MIDCHLLLDLSYSKRLPFLAYMLKLVIFLQMLFLHNTLKFRCPSSSSAKWMTRALLSKRRQLDDTPEVDVQSQYDAKRVQFQTKLGLNLEDPVFDIAHKTGQQMRKDRKKGHKPNKSKNKKSDVKTEPLKRFILGNGVEGLSSDSLLRVVESTAPYIFKRHQEDKLVLDDEDDDEDDEDDDEDDESNNGNKSEDHMFITDYGVDISALPPWERILFQSRNLRPSEKPSEEDRIRYFALCTASHFATVGSYVPSDVDSKIRGHCWYDRSEQVIAGQYEILKESLTWDASKVSKRVMFIDGQALSGHDGEALGSLMGAWGAFLRTGDASRARDVEERVEAELAREAAVFEKLRRSKPSPQSDAALLKVIAIVTHNVGDVDQGLSYWGNETMTPQMQELYQKYHRLSHERFERFGGSFGRAKTVYAKLLSAEGHRNYPLREAKCLRQHTDLLLPINPFLENWGRIVATHPSLSHNDRVSVVRQLLRGCDSSNRAWCVPNQIGYYRALYGVASAIEIESVIKDLEKDCKRVFKEHDMRHHLGISDEAFISSLGRQCRQLLS